MKIIAIKICVIPVWLIACLAQASPAADTSEATSTFSLTPVTHIYTPYLADQKRVTFSAQVLNVSSTDIPDTGKERFGLRMGGKLELFRSQWQSDNGLQLKQLQGNLEVGFRGHFDNTQSQDNIGWDGNYGFIFSYRGSDLLAYRFGIYHTSSHVGDEYAERTGRLRIHYTREEYLAGVLVNLTPQWQIYAEGGYAYNLKRKPLQQHKRAQTGIQYQQNRFATSEYYGWFTALDLQAYEERDWLVSSSFMIGFTRTYHPYTWRLSLEYYDGQSPLGEFFQHNESYLGLSLQLDI